MSAGQIYDLGYKRYVGSRRSLATRWRVIMRHQIATAWKGWWRFKPWFIAGLLATAVSGGVLYFLSGKMFRAIAGIGGQNINFADGILPWSMTWYCPIGFIASLFVCSSTVAGDIQSGAFTFYFARSVRPRDYVVGKLAGLCILLSLIVLTGPFLLAAVRLALSDDLRQVIGLLPVLYKALAIGAIGTLVYAAVPLGFSALVTNRRYAMALWAVYYIVIGSMAGGLSLVTSPVIGAIDVGASLKAVALHLFDAKFSGRAAMVPFHVALISIAAHTALAIGVVGWRVRNAQQTGVGGSS
jgi:hypothetical protein